MIVPSGTDEPRLISGRGFSIGRALHNSAFQSKSVPRKLADNRGANHGIAGVHAMTLTASHLVHDMRTPTHILRLVRGDQLSPDHIWFRQVNLQML